MLHVNVKRSSALLSMLSVVVLAVSACGMAPSAAPAPTAVVAPAATAIPTALPEPTATLAPAPTATTAANPAPAPASSSNAPASVPALSVSHNTGLGDILADAKGMVLYIYTPDKDGKSVCYDNCAKAWPPLLTTDGGVPVAPAGATEKFGVTERTDGTYQVTYNNMPLYYYVNDKAPGDATGQGKGNVWYVITLGSGAGSGTTIAVPTLAFMSHATLGNILTDAKGMTLYIYTPDKDGKSVCYDNCAKAWPPLLTSDDGVPTAPAGATEKFGVTERTDGTYQVTYNNMPLYYYVNDKAPGDATGQGKGGVWYVVTAGAQPAPAGDGGGYGGGYGG